MKQSIQTRAVHSGERVAAGDHIPTSTPIWPATAYSYNSMDDVDEIFAGERAGYVYSRYTSPTVRAFERAVASLEMAEEAIAFSSGMAAIHATLLAAGATQGATILAAFDLYGATYTLVKNLLASMGTKAVFINASDLNAVKTEMEKHKPCILLVETISNPLLKIANLPALGEIAKQYQAILMVDNTFATPFLCNPLQHGAEYVIHSATKYLAGHGDVLAGVVASSAENRLKLFEINKLVGGNLGPFEAWLALRGLKTLPLRIRQQCQNALRISEWIATHPRVSYVHYPGLPHHPQHHLAKDLFEDRGFGGVLSFELEDFDQRKSFRLMEALKLVIPATTLGDIYTLVMHPASSSHRGLNPEERIQAGISDCLIRLSAGIEDIDDILADLEQALEQIY